MPPFRPPKERIDFLAQRVLAELQGTHSIEVGNPEEVKAIFRAGLAENLRQEFEIEQEVMETLRKHGQQIYEQNVDFQKLLSQGKKIIAKKKGFTL